MPNSRTIRTRLAPSPTGALHLGNARTFLVNWLLARQRGWSIMLRIDDLDGPRIKQGMDRAVIEDLQWLGIDWDQGPIYQTRRLDIYQSAIEHLISSGNAYPCVCSRRETQLAASAPHADEGSPIYPGTCRGRFHRVADAHAATGRPVAIRFRTPGKTIQFVDAFSAPQSFEAAGDIGDFVIARGDGVPAYQLACAVDDQEMNIDHVVRGADLLDSTARQLLLMDALYPERRRPRYVHLPLITGADGRRLAKRHGDSRLSHYRSLGVTPDRVLELLGRWCGITFENCPGKRKAAATTMLTWMLEKFDLSAIDREPVVFSQADERFLFASALANPD